MTFDEFEKYLNSLPYENNEKNIWKFEQITKLMKNITSNRDISKKLFINTPSKGRGRVEFTAYKYINIIDCKNFAKALKMADFFTIFPQTDGNMILGVEVKNISEIKGN